MMNKKIRSAVFTLIAFTLISSMLFACCAKKTEPEDKNDPERFISGHASFCETAQAVLEGRELPAHDFSYSSVPVFFARSGEKTCAYTTVGFDDRFEESEEQYYTYYEPIAEYPKELFDMAQDSLRKYRKQYISPDTDEQYLSVPLKGFISENCVAFSDVSQNDTAVNCIFCRNDSGEWTELNDINAVFPHRMTGFEMNGSGIGFICFYDRFLGGSETETARKLFVFKTENGGQTWTDMGLYLPETYDPCSACFPYSPVFDGERGVLLVSIAFDGEVPEGLSDLVWFETADGGRSWNFKQR